MPMISGFTLLAMYPDITEGSGYLGHVVSDGYVNFDTVFFSPITFRNTYIFSELGSVTSRG
jgi:hypothetical protein